MSVTPKLGLPVVVAGESGAEQKFTQAMLTLEQFCFPNVIARQNAPSGGESDGAAYIVTATPSSEFAAFGVGQIAYLQNGGWLALTPPIGATCYVQNEGAQYFYAATNVWSATVQLAGTTIINGILAMSITEGIVASSTQTLGQGLLSTNINVIATCAVANDTVTLPVITNGIVNAAIYGGVMVVINNGAQTLQVFPPTAKAIDGGSSGASVTIASGKWAIFFSTAGGYQSIAGPSLI